MRVYAYTVTRADSPERARRLLDTLTTGRDTAGTGIAHWHLHINGGTLARGIAESATATGVLDSFTFSPHNTGQHPATNAAITSALADNYYALLRVDDDCKFLTRQWLTRMIDAALTLGPQFILSPAVKGLKNPMPTSTIAHKDNIPFVLLEAGVPLGGICRLIQAQTLRDYPYVSDVRKPMGLGDASGVGQWARANGLLCAYLKHVRVAHNTARQETEDSAHFTEHSLYQHIPYLPPWSPRG